MSTDSTTGRQDDVLDLLTQEHREVEDLVDQLSMPGTEEFDPRDIADVVIASLVRHSVAEEMYVYPAMREHLEDGESQVEHDIVEHQAVEETLKELEGLEPDDKRFPEVVDELRALLADHVRDEEEEQFPGLREKIPAEELVELRKKVEMAEKLAPTRPHPGAPHSELFHKVVGPGVGMVDRLRDAISGRITP